MNPAERMAALIAWMLVVCVGDLVKGGAKRRRLRRSTILDKIANANTVPSKRSRPLSGPLEVSDSNYDWVLDDTAPRARFCQRRDLGVRPRQHALSAPPESLAAGGRAHPRLHRRFFENYPRRGVPAAEGLLQALWHHHARADGGARPATRRIFGNGASDRPLAADAEPRARRGDRAALRPQAHSHKWHP